MHPSGPTGWIVRGLQFIFAVLVLSLSASLVANQPSGGSPSQVNYSVFVGVISLLTWLYTAAASQFSPDGLGAPMIVLILDALNTLWYFAGGVAMAVALRVHSCGNDIYVATNGIIAGSVNRCHIAQTLTAFLWFGFGIYLISSILVPLMGGGMASPRRSRGTIPAMRSV